MIAVLMNVRPQDALIVALNAVQVDNLRRYVGISFLFAITQKRLLACR